MVPKVSIWGFFCRSNTFKECFLFTALPVVFTQNNIKFSSIGIYYTILYVAIFTKLLYCPLLVRYEQYLKYPTSIACIVAGVLFYILGDLVNKNDAYREVMLFCFLIHLISGVVYCTILITLKRIAYSSLHWSIGVRSGNFIGSCLFFTLTSSYIGLTYFGLKGAVMEMWNYFRIFGVLSILVGSFSLLFFPSYVPSSSSESIPRKTVDHHNQRRENTLKLLYYEVLEIFSREHLFFFCMILGMNIWFIIFDHTSPLKFVEKGVDSTFISYVLWMSFPLEIFFLIIWHTRESSKQLQHLRFFFLVSYFLKTVFSLGEIVALYFMEPGVIKYYFQTALWFSMYSFSDNTVIFFINQYLSNVMEGRVVKIIMFSLLVEVGQSMFHYPVFFFVEQFSVKSCTIGADGGVFCRYIKDGFYRLSFIMLSFALVWMLFLRGIKSFR